MTVLTGRFIRAVDYARVSHTGQVRKGTAIPYLTHLLGVAALVIEHLGSEDQAIAGLLNPNVGAAVAGQLKSGQSGTLGHYESLARVFTPRGTSVAEALHTAVARMHAVADIAPRRPLAQP